MDNNFYQDDELEQFLQEEVKQHRMYPSDHIWKNIRTEVHGYKAWPALTFISLFIITALTISTLLNHHPVSQLVVNAASKNTEDANAAPGGDGATNPSAKENVYFESIAPANITAKTFANLTEETIVEIPVTRNINNDFAAVTVKSPAADRSVTTAKMVTRLAPVEVIYSPFEAHTDMFSSAVSEENSSSSQVTDVPKIADEVKETAEKTEAVPKKTDLHGADEFLKDFNYVTNTPKPRNSKFGIQFYVTPSTSYRKLSDQKVKDVIQPATSVSTNAVQNIPLSVNATADVNNVVRHKPAMGFEAGFAILYNMSGRLKFKTGLQLNVRQYYIETFQSRTNDLTSLSLINYRGVETISFYSPYNNNTGYQKTQLDNKVYQVSMPLGIQWDMIKGKRFGVSTEASVQPTITLNTNTYLLSTDYKHYTGGQDFIRKWNINTSVGLNLTYQTGKSSWQLGPQVRYQHLPTYSNLYPIKEFLLDYGVRLGFTRQIH